MVSSSVQYCCIHNVCKPVWSAVGRCFPRCQVAAFDPHITIESMERIIKASCLCCLLFEFAWFPIEWCRAYFTVNSQSSSAVENLVTNLVGQRRPQRIGYTKQGPTPCGKNHVVAGNWARSDMERQHSSRFLEEHFHVLCVLCSHDFWRVQEEKPAKPTPVDSKCFQNFIYCDLGIVINCACSPTDPDSCGISCQNLCVDVQRGTIMLNALTLGLQARCTQNVSCL